MIHSDKDFEALWFLYQTEGLPKELSIEEFCKKNGVDYETFDAWYRKTHKKVIPVNITGIPDEGGRISGEAVTTANEDVELEVEEKVASPDGKDHPHEVTQLLKSGKVKFDRITNVERPTFTITLRFSDGLKIFKRDITIDELKEMVARLEVIC